MNSSDRQSDDALRGSTLAPVSLPSDVRTQRDDPIRAPVLRPWLSGHATSFGYVACVALLAIGGAVIVHGNSPRRLAYADAALAHAALVAHAVTTVPETRAPKTTAPIAPMALEETIIFAQLPKTVTLLASPTQTASPTDPPAAEALSPSPPTVPSWPPQGDTPQGSSYHPLPNSLRANVASKGHQLRGGHHRPVDAE